MLEAEILQKMQAASIEERIVLIELLLQSLKAELSKITAAQPQAVEAAQRPAFGFMQNTGSILGDVVAPVLPETAWEALQ